VSYTLTPVDAARDASLVHGWVTRPRAEFWDMLDRTVEEVAEIYAWIQEQEHLAAYLIGLEGLDGDPVGIFQTYEPFVDEIGDHYDRRPGDIGMHLFLHDDARRAGHTARLVDFLLGTLFGDPAVRRVVLEPDVRNERSIALLGRVGALLGPVRRLPGKTAQFAFVDRETWTASRQESRRKFAADS